MHKINPGLYVKIGYGFLGSIFANYVSRTIWDSHNVELEPYALVNFVLSYRKKNMEIGLSVFNLLDSKHREHPDGEEVGRSVILSLKQQIH